MYVHRYTYINITPEKKPQSIFCASTDGFIGLIGLIGLGHRAPGTGHRSPGTGRLAPGILD